MTMNSLKALLGTSEPIRSLRALIAQVAPTDISVLIIGESGTGKELVARALHELSPRRAKPVLVVNCGAIPQGIFESEIFGHERGSFTGADRQRFGYFEQADGGTLVLDEIGEMPLPVQVKLLRVLEQGEFMRVGSSKLTKVNVRIIASTHVDLASAAARGEFRQDLYYRLKAVTISVPPLRDRISDIPILVEHFMQIFCQRNHMPIPKLALDAVKILQDQYWSGNIRELRNVIETTLTLERGASEITAENIRPRIQSTPANLLPVPLTRPPETLERELLFRTLLDLRREISEVKSLMLSAIQRVQQATEVSERSQLKTLEREQILRVLEENHGHRRKTAQELGIGERTLYRKLKEYAII
jgi:DNA-binding NtrC family response regulator